MRRRCYLLVAMAVFILGLAIPALAVEHASYSEQFLRDLHRSEAKLAELKTQLQASPQLDPATVDAYLVQCVWLVYSALCAYEMDYRDTFTPPADLHVLEGDYIAQWPQNPLHNWEPLRVLSLSDGFSPGDLVLQWCPPEFYSFVGGSSLDNRQPVSFELGVYGAAEDCAPLFDVDKEQYNTWREVPAGTLFMIGTYTETADVTLAKRKRREERKAKERMP